MGMFEWITELANVLGYRKNPSTKAWEVLVAQKGLPEYEATWEIIEDFKKQFPTFHLEVDLEGEGNNKPPILLQYSTRRKKGTAYMVGSVASSSNCDHVGPTVS